jgi:hypothetical protein
MWQPEDLAVWACNNDHILGEENEVEETVDSAIGGSGK